MKKKLLAGLLALGLLVGCATVAWAGSGADPLISLSYLNGAWLTDLRAYITQWVTQDTQGIYNDAVDKAGQGSAPSDGWTASGGFQAGTGQYGAALRLSAGSGLIWTAGSGYVTSGLLVDATAGVELAPGAALTAGHRCLAAEETEVVAASQSAGWLTEGRWKMGTGQVPLPFTDVALNEWYYEDVRFVVNNGLFQGVGNGRFSPGGTMERGMMTTVLHRLAGEPPVSGSQAFTDVPAGEWYAPGTAWCAQMKIVEGVGGGRFNPNGKVTREQIAVMLYKYAAQTGHNAWERGDLSAFPDAGSVSSWAGDAMSWAVGTKILNGSDGKLLPGNSATRAEVAAMLHRFQGWLDRQ